MLQLRHMRLLAEMSGVKYHEITPHMFGIDYDLTADYGSFVAAATRVPTNSSLVVLRTQVYYTNADETMPDYCFYRTFPPHASVWNIADSPSLTAAGQDWATAYLDTDVLLIFPSERYARLIFTPTTPIPATGTWIVRTIAYGYFVPARVVDSLQETQALTTGF
jgi:hypothetical protein